MTQPLSETERIILSCYTFNGPRLLEWLKANDYIIDGKWYFERGGPTDKLNFDILASEALDRAWEAVEISKRRGFDKRVFYNPFFGDKEDKIPPSRPTAQILELSSYRRKP